MYKNILGSSHDGEAMAHVSYQLDNLKVTIAISRYERSAKLIRGPGAKPPHDELGT